MTLWSPASIIRLASWLVVLTLTSTTFAGSGGGGPSAPDYTAELELLGCPACSRYPLVPDHNMARSVWDLQRRDGLVFGLEGDGNSNTGTNVTPPWVWYWDPTLGEFIDDYEMYDEQGHAIQVWRESGDLAMPGSDSLDWHGNVYRRENGAWRLFGRPTNIDHMWGTAQFGQDYFMAGNVRYTDVAAVKVSRDEGASWEGTNIVGVAETHAYAFLELDGQLYVHVDDGRLAFWRYDGGLSFTPTGLKMGKKGKAHPLDCRVRYYRGSAVYMWKRPARAIGVGGVYAATTPADAREVLKPPRKHSIVDFTVGENSSGEEFIYVVMLGERDRRTGLYPHLIYVADQSLSTWTAIASITVPNVMLSLEVEEGHMYLGESHYGSEPARSGQVWRLDAETIGN